MEKFAGKALFASRLTGMHHLRPLRQVYIWTYCIISVYRRIFSGHLLDFSHSEFPVPACPPQLVARATGHSHTSQTGTPHEPKNPYCEPVTFEPVVTQSRFKYLRVLQDVTRRLTLIWPSLPRRHGAMAQGSFESTVADCLAYIWIRLSNEGSSVV